jgi:hypothetical protein
MAASPRIPLRMAKRGASGVTPAWITRALLGAPAPPREAAALISGNAILRHALLASFALLAAGAAQAETIRDPGTGLAIDPPQGYSARLMPAAGNQAAVIQLSKPGDASDTGCRVGFADGKAQPNSTQAQLNEGARSEQMQQMASQAISSIYEVQEIKPFENGGVVGLQIVGDIKPRPNLPPRAQEIRSMLVMFDTPKGRTSVVCVGEKDQFAERLPEYHAIARAVTAPG